MEMKRIFFWLDVERDQTETKILSGGILWDPDSALKVSTLSLPRYLGGVPEQMALGALSQINCQGALKINGMMSPAAWIFN